MNLENVLLNDKEIKDKRLAVLLSGGVDSSVVVYELVRHGLHPDCFYIKIGPEEEEEWDCSSEEDMEMATAVAHKYGCRLQVVDCHREYWDEVTRYTMDKVRAGLTPNPDVMCNRLIKFGAFDQKMGHNYDLIATGHYAQTEIIDGHKWLTTSPDPVKDQTDFLAQIEAWQLKKALFPIGHFVKDEVRQIAEREHLVNARRKDSQGICFLGKINYNDYLRRYLGEKPGDVVELETGRRIGEHRGLWFHTIGQRKGLGFGFSPSPYSIRFRRLLARLMSARTCVSEISICPAISLSVLCWKNFKRSTSCSAAGSAAMASFTASISCRRLSFRSKAVGPATLSTVSSSMETKIF